MPETAELYQHSVTKDSIGGAVASWLHTGSFPCRFTRPRGHEKVERGTRLAEAGRLGDTGVIVPADVYLTVGDRLLINGTIYEVIITDDLRSFRTANEYYLNRVAA